MNQRKFIRFLSLLFLVMFVLYIASSLFSTLSPGGISYSKMVELFQNEQVSSFRVSDNVITLELNSPLAGMTTVHASLGSEAAFRSELGDLIRDQAERGILTSYSFSNPSAPSLFEKAMPYLIAGVVLLVIWVFLANRAGGSAAPGAAFTKANAAIGSKKKVTFADVAGVDEEKAELQEVVEFLRAPEKFKALGAKIPKGFLLVGPPGTGKTLLAKAVAGEADVQFLSISGSSFMELYVGVGASRVRDLFNEAKKVAPAIIFIDEIDAVGRRRGTGIGGGNDEREQTLNQLLVEMDGFEENENIVVLAATNRADVLDPALLRPGRFDRQVHVGIPVASGREDILKVHAKNKRLADNVDLHKIAQRTAGFTGADLANLLNEGAILAARNGQQVITMANLDDAMMKITAGPEKKSWHMTKEMKYSTAIHEAGHAVAAYRCPNYDPVHKITIIPRNEALGLTMYLPSTDRFNLTRKEMFHRILVGLGGRVAEALFLDDISTGASNDLERATNIARDMVGKYGMTDSVGPVSYASDGEVFLGRDYEKTKSYSERVAGEMDATVRKIMDEAYAKCKAILEQDADKVKAVTAFLMEHETMDGDQFAACMEGKEIPASSSGSFFQ